MTDHHFLATREPYHGRVIDGPFEGEVIGSDVPYFVGRYSQRLYALYTGWDAGVEVCQVVYKWLPSYRAWAWWQKS